MNAIVQRRWSWFLQGVAAVILGQTLFFKFSGAAESRQIFTTLGVEPWGRIATGVAELIAVVLLLHPRWCSAGALLSWGLMTGALGSHLTKLGIVVADDGGLLFGLACLTWVSACGILFLRRSEWMTWVRLYSRGGAETLSRTEVP